jgi:hypothetical protein
MKKVISVLALALMAGTVFAQGIDVQRRNLGSGTPGLTGMENATKWADTVDVYHLPQYLPGYPTAASIWPRAVEVQCKDEAGKKTCDGYDWQPKYGRGEYLFVHAVPAKEPKVIIKETVKVVEVPKIVEIPCCHKPIKE